jgi:hypothetical protein
MTETNTTRELPADIVEAEAIARSDESRASILRQKALVSGGDYVALADAAAADAQESASHVAKLDEDRANLPRDLSGVSRGLSDSFGNFAPNVEVMTTGGIGVDASNTNVETGEPAQNAEEAGTPSEAQIPADWEGSHWRTRVALAEKISGRDDVKTEEANGIIAAEVARRG